MDKLYFVTVTGIEHYYGKKPFRVGRVFQLIKDHRNTHDTEAIMAYLPFLEKIGYVANSVNTVYHGTVSAGRLYDKIGEYAFAKVMFITHSSVIAVVLDRDELEAALAARAKAHSAVKRMDEPADNTHEHDSSDGSNATDDEDDYDIDMDEIDEDDVDELYEDDDDDNYDEDDDNDEQIYF